MFVKKEHNKRISGVLITPIFYDEKENELIILGSSLEIEKSDIFLEQKICAGRKLIMLEDGKKYIVNEVIE